MKRLASLLALLILFQSSLAAARGIGDYARDYSWRAERARISRENIAAQRATRVAERLERRRSRTRAVPRQSRREARISPESRLEARRRARLERWNVAKQRGDERRFARTREQKRENKATKVSWRLDARRRSDLRKIMDILVPYVLNPDLEHADLLPTTEKYICKTGFDFCGGASLDPLLAGSELNKYPVDPEEPHESTITGYTVHKMSSGSLLLTAPRGNNGSGALLEWKPLAE